MSDRTLTWKYKPTTSQPPQADPDPIHEDEVVRSADKPPEQSEPPATDPVEAPTHNVSDEQDTPEDDQ